MIAVTLAGVFIHTVKKERLVVKFQQLKALYRVEGYDMLGRIHPYAPDWGILIVHGSLLFRLFLHSMRLPHKNQYAIFAYHTMRAKRGSAYVSAAAEFAGGLGFEPDGMSQEQMKEMTIAFHLPK